MESADDARHERSRASHGRAAALGRTGAVTPPRSRGVDLSELDSNSAIEPRTPATSLPACVLVSIPLPRVTNAMPRERQSSSNTTRAEGFD